MKNYTKEDIHCFASRLLGHVRDAIANSKNSEAMNRAYGVHTITELDRKIVLRGTNESIEIRRNGGITQNRS